VPAGWVTFDSQERRIGYSNGYGLGCRILQLTGSPRDFSYGLYFRNTSGETHQGYAKYGLSDASTALTLPAGHYTLSYRICNWNRESFSKVEISVEKATNGEAVATTEYMPTVNVGNSAGNSFSGTTIEKFEFDITKADNYAIAVYSDAAAWSDALIGYLSLEYTGDVATAIKGISESQSSLDSTPFYNLSGQPVGTPTKGIYILNGKKILR
jgi:hypothetical protein